MLSRECRSGKSEHRETVSEWRTCIIFPSSRQSPIANDSTWRHRPNIAKILSRKILISYIATSSSHRWKLTRDPPATPDRDSPRRVRAGDNSMIRLSRNGTEAGGKEENTGIPRSDFTDRWCSSIYVAVTASRWTLRETTGRSVS